MKMRNCFVAAFMLWCSTAMAESFTVTIKVVTEDQKPIAKADVALFWNVKNGAMTPGGEKPAVTDANGKALLRVDDWKFKRPVLVLSEDRTLGAFFGVNKDDAGKELTVTLGPTVKEKGKVDCTELGRKA